MNTITLGGDTLPIQPPASPSLAIGVARVGQASPEFAMGAAIALCVPALAQKAGVHVDILDLGGTGQSTFDWLIGRLQKAGNSGAESLRLARDIGNTCVDAILEQIPRDEQVQEALGNSETTP